MSWSLDQRRPKPNQDPKGWCKFWEEELEWFYSRPEERIIEDSKASEYLASVSEGLLATLHSLRQAIALYRQTISRVWITAYSQGRPVDVVWAEKGRQGREEIMVKALVNFVIPPTQKDDPNSRNREDTWMWCPEVTRQTMCEGNGEAYIKLLRHFLVKDCEITPSLNFPILKDSRLWRLADFSDDESIEARRPEGVRAYHNRILVERHYFLINFVQHALVLLFDLSVTYEHRLSPRTKNTTEQKALLNSTPSFPPVVKAAVDADRKKSKPLVKLFESMGTCTACSKLDDPKMLFACSGCRKVGRRVLYCSKACQKMDYKHGQPPHKEICSKYLRDVPLDFATDSTSSEPDPFPLYTTEPSAALLLQLHFLKREKFAWDYNITTSNGNVLRKCFLEELKTIFLAARKNAMEKQDLASIGIMELILQSSVEKEHQSSVNVPAQLENEYTVTMKDCRAAAKSNADFNYVLSTRADDTL